MSTDPKGIGLLGGSFDPVHNGHVAICRSYLNSIFIDKLYVILTPDPPHKGNRELTDFSHRFRMLNLALGGIENLSVSDVEKILSKPSYTVNTVKHFKKEFPDQNLDLCIGEDSYKQFTDWFHWEEIIEKCMLLVARRPRSDEEDLPEKLRNSARFIEHEEIAISSSDIRNRLKNGKEVAGYLPEAVLHYIHKEQLYQNKN